MVLLTLKVTVWPWNLGQVWDTKHEYCYDKYWPIIMLLEMQNENLSKNTDLGHYDLNFSL